jgi:outer membrane protein OmpA-like peptidoglycan-associated protein
MNKGIKKIFYSVFLFICFQPLALSQIQTCDISSKSQLEYIIKLYAPSEDAFVALQKLAKPFIDKKEFNDAAILYKSYLDKFPEMQDRINKIIHLLTMEPEGLDKLNLGGGVNSQFKEYGPVIFPDGKKIYFTAMDREDGIGGEDVFVSEYKGSSWQLARKLSDKINTESNEYMNSISADGNILVLFGNYANQLGRGDNFYVEKTKKGWTDIKHFPEPINSVFWDADAYLTADGKAIFFASERPGGAGAFKKKGECFHDMYWGNIDIWVVTKNKDGTWNNQAINIGGVINTPYTERTPFLHPDGKTLYFSSDGHYGIGKSDVFRSVRLSDTSWTEWSAPVNLGIEINTTGEDWGYKISTDGKKAFFSTSVGSGFGQEDLYSVNLPEEVQPEKDVFTIYGKVLDEKGNPVEATIKWEDVLNDKEVGESKTDAESGDYIVILPTGKYYAYYAVVKGYYSDIAYLDLTNAEDYKEIKADVNIVSIENLISTGKAIKLEHIFFDTDKYELKEASYNSLNRLLKFLIENNDIMLEINAHTDSRGSVEYNIGLSEKRAASVVNYLIEKGIKADMLLSNGFGESQPVADNDTEEGRSLNRRVEFRLVKKPN